MADGEAGSERIHIPSNESQNRQFSDAIRSAERQLGRRLAEGERRIVHDAISGEELTYQEIIDLVVDLFGP